MKLSMTFEYSTFIVYILFQTLLVHGISLLVLNTSVSLNSGFVMVKMIVGMVWMRVKLFVVSTFWIVEGVPGFPLIAFTVIQ